MKVYPGICTNSVYCMRHVSCRAIMSIEMLARLSCVISDLMCSCLLRRLCVLRLMNRGVFDRDSCLMRVWVSKKDDQMLS